MENIDWTGESVEYEDIKNTMRVLAIRRIRETYEKYNAMLVLSEFFEQRHRSNYGNYYCKLIEKLPNNGGEFPYIIWGAGQVGMEVVRIMHDKYPKGQLIGVIDSYTYGKKFNGVEIESPDCIKNKYQNVFCIVTTYSGRKFVVDYMKKINKIDYMDFSSVNG